MAARVPVRANQILALRGVPVPERLVPPLRPPKGKRGRDKKAGAVAGVGSPSGPYAGGDDGKEEEEEGEVQGASMTQAGGALPARGGVHPPGSSPPLGSPTRAFMPPPPRIAPWRYRSPPAPPSAMGIASSTPTGPPLWAFLQIGSPTVLASVELQRTSGASSPDAGFFHPGMPPLTSKDFVGPAHNRQFMAGLGRCLPPLSSEGNSGRCAGGGAFS